MGGYDDVGEHEAFRHDVGVAEGEELGWECDASPGGEGLGGEARRRCGVWEYWAAGCVHLLFLVLCSVVDEMSLTCVFREVARLFTALGSQVVAYTAGPRRTAESRADAGYIVPGTGDPSGTLPVAWYSGTTKSDLHNFLRQGLDLLVICLPLTSSTEKSIGKDEFQILASACTTPGGPYVANISRGKIIDQPALVEALNGGVLGGAMLDVADPEPLPKEDPLWSARNVIVTPHVSGLGVEYKGRAYDVLITNLERREKGERMFNLVDRRKGY